jgi:hypothetical protein
VGSAKTKNKFTPQDLAVHALHSHADHECAVRPGLNAQAGQLAVTPAAAALVCQQLWVKLRTAQHSTAQHGGKTSAEISITGAPLNCCKQAATPWNAEPLLASEKESCAGSGSVAERYVLRPSGMLVVVLLARRQGESWN